MKTFISFIVLVQIIIACNTKKTKPATLSVQDVGNQKKHTDTTKYDIILALGHAMGDLAYDLDTMKLTGDPDIDFSKIIQRHHRAGMDMAKAELDAGKDTALKALALKITNRQLKEIAELKVFSNEFKPQSASGFGKRAKEMMYKKPGSGLPMHGAIMDHDFTSMMLLHHYEGVNLAKEYLKDGKVPQVRRIADEIVEMQSKETTALKNWKSKNVRDSDY